MSVITPVRVAAPQIAAPHIAAPSSAPSRAATLSSSAATRGVEALGLRATATTRTMRIGSTGADVKQLHATLAALHYAGVDPTSSTYTEATHHAVMAFQKVNGLYRDGIAGPQTQRALANPKQPVIGTGPANRFVVDVSDQTGVLVRNGKIEKIVSVSTAASGQSPTPRGSWKVGGKVPGNHPRLGEQMYYSSFFKGNFAVHGNPNVPAWPASHGCVRVPMALAKQLYTDMPMGFVVTVRD